MQKPVRMEKFERFTGHSAALALTHGSLLPAGLSGGGARLLDEGICSREDWKHAGVPCGYGSHAYVD